MNKRFLESRRKAFFKLKEIIERSLKDWSIIHNETELEEAYIIYRHLLQSNEPTITWYSNIAHICKKCGLKVVPSTCDSYEIGYYYI